MASQPPPTVAGPARTVLAQHQQYLNAQADVDTLSDRGFPVTRLSIVGTDLYLAETVTGRATALRAAARSAASGAGMGVLLGALLTLLTAAGPLAVPIGAAVGALLGGSVDAAGHMLPRGRRDFTAAGQLTAARYLVLVDTGWADDARLLLIRGPEPAPVPTSAVPPGRRPTAGRPTAFTAHVPGEPSARPP